ncbi:molybdopterin-dependent oxidoreductase [Chloroflexota bacterium]
MAIVTLVFSCSPVQHTPKTISLPPSEEQKPSEPESEEPIIEQPSDNLYYLINSDPSGVDNTNLPITPTEKLSRTAPAPELNIREYRLTIDGLVETPLILTHEEIMEYPAVTEVMLLICPGVFADNAEWTGVPVTTLLAEAGIKPQASMVAFRALDGFHRVLSLEVIQQDGVFLAHTVNGEILPLEHGYPLRLVVRGQYGMEWVKWIEHIEVL